MARSSTSFKRGQSGNPGGRPKESKTYSVRELVARAMDPATEESAMLRLREVLGQRKTVVTGLEFAARVNREIGLRSGEAPAGGVTIIFETNVDFSKLDAARSRALPLKDGTRVGRETFQGGSS